MTPSTPLPEQGVMTKHTTSDELRQQITDICFENGGVTKPMVDKLVVLIKQHELDARLDEAERFLNYDLFGTLQRIERTNDAVNRRIAELKAEREAL